MSVDHSDNTDEMVSTRSSTTRLGRGRRGSRRRRLGQTTVLRIRSVRNGHERSNESFEQLTKSMITSVSQLASQLSAGLGQLHIDMNSLTSSLMSASGGPKAPTRTSDDSRQEGIEVGQPEAVRLTKVGQLTTERARSEFVANEDCAFPQGMGTEVIRADDWIKTRSTTNIQSPDAASTNRVLMGTQPLIPSVAIEPFDGNLRNWETFTGNFKALFTMSSALTPRKWQYSCNC
ncbi:hypothetical protein M513_09807 [Trichuris suis]|uniref:Uncharacterized protein n=1 Tax=Trichuris suis TaxID=68888 RepID=A0A085LWA9_9BILA|nr:hypothetical protein M513_09807 [Trichuris suis]